MLNAVKQGNDQGAIAWRLSLKDLTGQTEAVVFPAFERFGSLLIADTRMIIWGKVDRRDEIQLIVEDAEPVETVQLLMVELTRSKQVP